MLDVYAQISCCGPISLGFNECVVEPIAYELGERMAISIVRKYAHDAGWRRIDGYDLCPRCTRAYRAAKKIGKITGIVLIPQYHKESSNEHTCEQCGSEDGSVDQSMAGYLCETCYDRQADLL